PYLSTLGTDIVWYSPNQNNYPANCPLYQYKTIRIGSQMNNSDDTSYIDFQGTSTKWYQSSVEDENHLDFFILEVNTQPTINFTITNTYEAASVSVTKFWDHTGNTGTRPTQAVVTLYSNGTPAENQVVATLNGHDDTHTWSDLPIKDEEGNAISYTVQENQIANYKASPTSTEVDGEIHHTITNTYVPDGAKTNISVKKVWDHDGNNGNQPDSVTVQLYKNGQAEGAPVSLNNTNNNECTWTDLPMKDSNGNVINYTVGEDDVPGYEAAITSTYTPPITSSTAGGWSVAEEFIDGGTYLLVHKESGKDYAINSSLKSTSYINGSQSPADAIQWVASASGSGFLLQAKSISPARYISIKSGNLSLNSSGVALTYSTSGTDRNKIRTSSGTKLYLAGRANDYETDNSINNAIDFIIYKLNTGTTTSNAQTSYTITNTYKPAVDIDLYKVSADDTPIPLGGAEFALYKFDSTAPAIIPGTADVPGTRVGGTYTSSSLDVNKGYATLSALEEGTYYLIETLAPDGYNKLNEPIVFTISQSGEVAITSGGAWATVATGASGHVLTVKNQRGYTLPETGGRGNRPYILAGLLTLALGLAVYHVYQRFKRAEGRCEPS
ncbi:Cna B-type domain-containing protein, partial [Eubacteriales bacterium OttesenSCG-928-K08]|nr:Cna B-type domain-containing protein [Eubacteriales bacterium OttesenSCG-928-K08]